MQAHSQPPRLRSRLPSALFAIAIAGLPACSGKGQAPDKANAKDPPAPAPSKDLVATAAANGFGDSIAWQPLEGALGTAKERELPVMLVVHASWCNRCKELKPAFSDNELVELSKKFVMVNADQDLEPKSLEFAPDGDYIPRVVFIDPKTGQSDNSLKNERRSRNLYFYTPRDDLKGVMKKALARHGKT